MLVSGIYLYFTSSYKNEEDLIKRNFKTNSFFYSICLIILGMGLILLEFFGNS
ncbi:hypothetical protein HMPREF0766_14461 [Sphingobacterium spiritivorum ATCC 33861]|uniref:Uncharacterized protein n=1 Tax=Sphingobacterium spiritivorum ATCC 33861 TaxID=525373 RepID=D7VTZ1_SPHSI|nr:hypothetical protein HMPREF0766_14461 [Sphingobacterium spiritivorum ATCC 33861]